MTLLLQEYSSMEKCVQVLHASNTKRNLEKNDKRSCGKKPDKQWTRQSTLQSN
ncbi:hypothetical protein [Holospora elegans]|uniref:hypothetical protein n=1 Tax=Holospora elegans TaxID=431043 RepID=UPI00039A67C1|nr:hypothetical protein [Holospora elegans]